VLAPLLDFFSNFSQPEGFFFVFFLLPYILFYERLDEAV